MKAYIVTMNRIIRDVVFPAHLDMGVFTSKDKAVLKVTEFAEKQKEVYDERTRNRTSPGDDCPKSTITNNDLDCAVKVKSGDTNEYTLLRIIESELDPD